MADTQKEKALKIIAKQIKELDKAYLTLDVLYSKIEINAVRANFFNILSKHGYEITADYKLKPKK